jgi:hypothetical protein
MLPICPGGCPNDHYCSSDCKCHSREELRPDLVVNTEALATVEFSATTFTSTSCALYEGCVKAAGDRYLMRMTINTPNQGLADLAPPDPKTRPDLFTYSPCHGHYHFDGYAVIDLLEKNSDKVVAKGSKVGFCMEDTEQYHLGPAFSCASQFDCGFQGISAGWADVYGPSLDCNWIDITDVPAGEYRLRVEINKLRILDELTFDNNIGIVNVVVPPSPYNPVESPESSGSPSSDTSSPQTHSNNNSPRSSSSVLIPAFFLAMMIAAVLV